MAKDLHSVVNNTPALAKNKDVLGTLVREGCLNAKQVQTLGQVAGKSDRGQAAVTEALRNMSAGREARGLLGQKSRPLEGAEFRQYVNSAIGWANNLGYAQGQAPSQLKQVGAKAQGQQQRRASHRASSASLRANLDYRP
jgi:hydroxypyruvate isomerase